MKSTLFLATILILSFCGCKSQQYSYNELPEKQLIFGSGGGITGAIDTYVLLENGQIFHKNSLTKEVMELESMSKKEAKSCFVKLKELALSEMDFNHPGNIYFFLETKEGDESHRVTWGSNDHDISEECRTLYKELKSTLR